MIFVGVDPGKKGALAFLEDGSAPRLVPIPMIKHLRGQGRDEFDLAGIRRLLFPLTGVRCLVTVEKSQPLPPRLAGANAGGSGAIANFSRGVARGWDWALAMLQIPHQLIAPVTWQRALFAGTPEGSTKQRSILAAQRLFPDVELRRSQRCWTLDDGFADALLLAEFGRRTHRGVAA